MRFRTYLVPSLTLLAILLVAPTTLQACPVCFGATDEGVLQAYLFGAFFLSAMPLAIIGSIAGWIYFTKKRTTRAAAASLIPSEDRGGNPGPVQDLKKIPS